MPTTVPPCPRCGGPMWDNRADKKSPKGPDFKCKNKGCVDEKGFVTALWEKKPDKPATAPALASGGFNPPGVMDADLPAFLRLGGTRVSGTDDRATDDKAEKIDALIETYVYVTAKLVPELDRVYKQTEIGLSPEAAQAAVATVVIQMGRTGLV